MCNAFLYQWISHLIACAHLLYYMFFRLRLIQLGSKRCHDSKSPSECLPPALGSGPETTSSGSGFYTTEDYKDILRRAASRHIVVIPEIDMPGHARAAIKSMESNPKYKLSDELDTSKYAAQSAYRDNALNPCLESAYTFVRHIMNELKNLHKDIQPLTVFHFGGDEVAKGAWMGSPKCQNLLKTEQDLKKYFVKRVAGIAKELNLSVGAWEDGIMYNATSPYDRNIFQGYVFRVYSINKICVCFASVISLADFALK